jgi:GNAT superfamily N-acetyltransferase
MRDLQILPVSNDRDLNDFICFPWKVYPQDSNWVPPLKKEIQRLLDVEKHPFWKFSRRKLFLARRGGEIVGRIAGIIDDNHNKYHNERMGAWGFFECMNDREAASRLFSAVEDWVAKEGMTFLRGPLNPSTNYTVGLLIEGFEQKPTIMMPWNHPYYVDLVEGAGFTKVKDLITMYMTQEDRPSERIERLARRVEEKGKIRSRNGSRKNVDSEMALIADIYKSAWADNWGFIPMTEDEVREMGRNLLPIMREELTFFMYCEDEPVGVVIILPDMNPLLKRLNGKIGPAGIIKYLLYRREVRGYRGVIFGVKKPYQKRGVPLVAANHLTRFLRGKKGADYLELGWNLEDNDGINKLEIEGGARINKKYRIYEKSLSK